MNRDALVAEAHVVARNMDKYGGSFASALAKALIKADLENIRKIKDTWPQYWATYLNWDRPS
jgi:hypothetical protein